MEEVTVRRGRRNYTTHQNSTFILLFLSYLHCVINEKKKLLLFSIQISSQLWNDLIFEQVFCILSLIAEICFVEQLGLHVKINLCAV